MINKYLKIVFSSLLLSLGACHEEDAPVASSLCNYSSIDLSFNKSATLHTEIACTREQKMVGLMNRKTLPADGGMIFVYDYEHTMHFWMKDTYVPLSIAFVDSHWKIIDIQNMKALDTSITTSKSQAQYSIEAPLNWFANHNVTVGNTVTHR